MKWRVLLELTEVNGHVQTHEMVTGDRPTKATSPETIGLTLAEGKSVFAAIQAKLVQAQADEYWRSFVGEEIFGNDDFGLLKHDIAAMARDGGRLKKTAIVALARSVLQTHTERSSI